MISKWLNRLGFQVRMRHINAIFGFTLMELIIVITIAAILGSLLLPFLGKSFTDSTDSIFRFKEQNDLIQIMEKITADYQKLMTNNSASALTTLKSRIDSLTYGTYTPTTEYIDFDAGQNQSTDISGFNRTLKVSITINEQKMVALFTQ